MQNSDLSAIKNSPNGMPRTDAEIQEDKRRKGWEQTLASTAIEGHLPSPAFLADVEANIKGTLSIEDLRIRSTQRILAESNSTLPG